MATLQQAQQLQIGDGVYIRGKSFVVSVTPDRSQDGYLYLRGKKHMWRFAVNADFAASIRSIVPKAKRKPYKEKKNYAFVSSDGGKTIPTEQRDCTVRALALATGVSYDVAHSYLKQYGRKEGKGLYVGHAYRACTLNGYTFVEQGSHNIFTVGQWLKSGKLPERCILQVSKHVIAVVNNVVLDSFKVGSSRKVMTVWRITK